MELAKMFEQLTFDNLINIFFIILVTLITYRIMKEFDMKGRINIFKNLKIQIRRIPYYLLRVFIAFIIAIIIAIGIIFVVKLIVGLFN